MAQRTIIELTDDLDGKPADETLTFSLDGTMYEIDLSTKNAGKLRSKLAPFIETARKAPRQTSGRGKASRSSNSRERSHEIRVWAKAKGLKVNDRGRIPASIVEQYDAAH